jgi:hypothetical protein
VVVSALEDRAVAPLRRSPLGEQAVRFARLTRDPWALSQSIAADAHRAQAEAMRRALGQAARGIASWVSGLLRAP